MYFYVCDIETTGLQCGHNEITEVSVLDCQSMEQVTWMIKIKYPERFSKQALYITKKTNEELMSRGRYIEDVLDEINDFILKDDIEIDDICIIGHNVVNFDRKFLEYYFSLHGKSFPARYYLDTLVVAKRYTKTVLGLQKTSHALNELMVTANVRAVETENLHSSSVDVRNNYRLWKKMVAGGMNNSEFIKMSPAYLAEVATPAPLKKKGKKSKAEEFSLEDIMEEQTDQPFEEDDDD